MFDLAPNSLRENNKQWEMDDRECKGFKFWSWEWKGWSSSFN